MPIHYLAAIIVLLIIIVIAFVLQKRIKLIYVRLSKGEFHHKYISLYKKYTNTNPHGYCIKDEYVYHVLFFKEIEEKVPVYQTGIEIEFGHTPFFSSFQSVRDKSKNHICYQAYNHTALIRIMGYKTKLFNYSARTLFYFVDDRFFMGEFTIKIDKSEKLETIRKAIAEKYLNLEITDQMFYIKDNQQNMLHFSDNGFNIIVRYISFQDNEVNKALDLIVDSLKKPASEISTERDKEFVKI